MTTRRPRDTATMLATLSSRRDFDARYGLGCRAPLFPRGYGTAYASAHALPPVAAYEPPPAGPDDEPEDEFQRRIDELLSERRPLWRDMAFWTCVLGIWSLGMAAACYLIAH